MYKLSILFQNWTSCSLLRSINLPFPIITLLSQHKYEEEERKRKGKYMLFHTRIMPLAASSKIHFLGCISSTKWNIKFVQNRVRGVGPSSAQSVLLRVKYIANSKELLLVLHTVLQELSCNYLIWCMQGPCRVPFHK